MNPIHFSAVKFINRVLTDYPMARARLIAYAGKTVSIEIAGTTIVLRVDQEGKFEMVGSGSQSSGINDSNGTPGGGINVLYDVSFAVPLKLVPRLARGDETAYSEIVFSGDSEFASTLSTIARNVKWDVEQDLSHVVGDVAAHRMVGTATSLNKWQQESTARLTENIAEYLTEEKRAFITERELESLAALNETLRDGVARLDARLTKFVARS